MKMVVVRELSEDILFFNILPRLGVKSLLRFSCVSKLWNTTIHDPSFAETHFIHSKAKPSCPLAIITIDFAVRFLYLSNDERNKCVDFETHSDKHHLAACTPPKWIVCDCKRPPAVGYESGTPACYISHCGGVRCIAPTYHRDDATWRPEHLVGSCNGLTCIATIAYSTKFANHRVHILNPSTRELLSIPEPITKTFDLLHYNFGFGYDSVKKEYKIVALVSARTRSRHFGNRRTYCMIYTLGSSTSSSNIDLCCWRDISDACPSIEVLRCSRPLLSGGGLFWVQEKDCSHYENIQIEKLVRFDIHLEQFQVIEAPPVPKRLLYCVLLEVGENPCILYSDVDDRRVKFCSMKNDYDDDGSNQMGKISNTKQLRPSEASARKCYWIKESLTLDYPEDSTGCLVHLVESSSKQMLMQWLNIVDEKRIGKFTLYNPHDQTRQHVRAMEVQVCRKYPRMGVKHDAMIVNPVENLLSLKSLVAAGAHEIEYLSSREAPYRPWFANDSPQDT